MIVIIRMYAVWRKSPTPIHSIARILLPLASFGKYLLSEERTWDSANIIASVVVREMFVIIRMYAVWRELGRDDA